MQASSPARSPRPRFSAGVDYTRFRCRPAAISIGAFNGDALNGSPAIFVTTARPICEVLLFFSSVPSVFFFFKFYAFPPVRCLSLPFSFCFFERRLLNRK